MCQAAAETHHPFNVSITLNYTELHSTRFAWQMSLLIHLEWKELWTYEINLLSNPLSSAVDDYEVLPL